MPEQIFAGTEGKRFTAALARGRAALRAYGASEKERPS
jgi:hypothetical protein